MRTKRSIVAIGVVFAFTTLTTACSSEDSQPLLATIKCSPTLWTVELRKTDTGEVADTRHFRLPSSEGASCNEATTVIRSKFNEGFDKLAYRKQVVSGFSAGYLKPTDDPKKASAFVDLSGDDGAGPRPRQTEVTFGPEDNLYFVDEGQHGAQPRLLMAPTDSDKKATPKEVFANDASVQAYLDGTDSIDDDAPEGHSEVDEQGNRIVHRESLHFLPGGKKPAMKSHLHAVYNDEGSWGFTRESDDDSGTTMRFGDLQGDGSDVNTVDLDKRPDGSWVEIGPAVFVNENAFISHTYAGIDFVTVNRDRAAKTAGSIKLKDNEDITSVADLDKERFVFVKAVKSANGKSAKAVLYVAHKAPKMEPKRVIDLGTMSNNTGFGVLGMTD